MAEKVGIATSDDVAVTPAPRMKPEPVLAPPPPPQPPVAAQPQPQPLATPPPPPQPPVAVAKVYTDYSKIQKDLFPESLRSKGQKWMCQKKNLIVPIGTTSLHITSAVTFKDKLGKLIHLNKIVLGGYKIKFEGFYYTSNNKLEEKALEKQPKVICTGPA